MYRIETCVVTALCARVTKWFQLAFGRMDAIAANAARQVMGLDLFASQYYLGRGGPVARCGGASIMLCDNLPG
jgi:hypothetical protein